MCGNDTELDVGSMSLRPETDEVREIVLVPVTVLVPVPETVVAVILIMLPVADEVTETTRVSSTVLLHVRRQVWRCH